MKLHVIIASIYVEGQIDAFHYSMYHGVAGRAGVEYPHNIFYSSDSHGPHRLEVTKNSHLWPDIIKPAENLLVSKRVRDQLAHLPSVKFLRVAFVKIFNHPFQLGDFSHWKDERYGGQAEPDPRAFIDRLPEVKGCTPPDYYEVLVPSYQRIERRYASAMQLAIDGAEGHASELMLAENAIVTAPPGYFMGDTTFQVLEQFLDERAFRHSVANV